MEFWDLYNKDKEKLNKVISKEEKLKDGEYHKSVHIWIINDNDEFLIQRRSENKKHFPNMWSMTGGAVLSDEESTQACVREIKEELDIDVKTDDLVVIGTINRPNSFVDIYLLKNNTTINDIKKQVDEVSEVAWVKKENIDMLLMEEKFTPSVLEGYVMCLKYISSIG